MDAAELLKDAIVWDNHGCLPLRPDDERFLPELARYRQGGATVVSLNVGFGEQGPEEHLRMLATLRSWLAGQPDDYILADTASDIRAAKTAGKLAVVFDIEGMNAVADQPNLVHAYYRLGVRWMLLAFNTANRAGGGCITEGNGLRDFGRAVIDEMEHTGMLLCCSHTGHRTAREAIAYSRNPVIFSHSNPSTVWPHPRNIPDDLMLACAATGGVIGINGVGAYLGANDASTKTLLRHINHALAIVGEDHVGLGLDYMFDLQELEDYIDAMGDTFPAELGLCKGLQLVEPERLPAIAQAMLDQGHSATVTAKILGGNFMRLAEQVWR